jgi:hypothetical protein
MHPWIRIDRALLITGGLALGLPACALEDAGTDDTLESTGVALDVVDGVHAHDHDDDHDHDHDHDAIADEVTPAPQTMAGTSRSDVGVDIDVDRAGAGSEAPLVIAAAGPLYDLPLLANDLGDLERYFTRDHAQTFSQKFAYDVSTRRRTSGGSWTSLKEGVTNYSTDPKNTDTLAWGRNFYAIADGVVVGCWRNAPSNPRPRKAGESTDVPLAEKEWLHQELRDGRISGAGNHLTVLHDDGTYALYAHAIPGSIPSSLCPNNGILYPAPAQSSDPRSEHCVRTVQAVTNGARITKGQKLGRIGNSGNSTGPHLHFHVTKRDTTKSCTSSTAFEGLQMKFARGLSTPWNGGNADIDAWTSFSGAPIPTGQVLFWPPTKGDEYTRHAFSPADFSRLFTHLSNSGFKPILFDGYTVGSDTRFNFVWRAKDRPWKMWRDMNLATMNSTIQTQANLGYEPVWAESYTTANGVRYAAIFESGTPGDALLKTNLSVAEHDAWLETAKSQGFKPKAISVVSSGGQLRYTVLYRTNSIGSWVLRSQIAASDYQGVYDDEAAAGRWPIYANAYLHDGTSRFSVVFASSGGPAAAGHGLTSSGFNNMWQANTGLGRRTQVVTGYDGAQTLHRFLGVWK